MVQSNIREIKNTVQPFDQLIEDERSFLDREKGIEMLEASSGVQAKKFWEKSFTKE